MHGVMLGAVVFAAVLVIMGVARACSPAGRARGTVMRGMSFAERAPMLEAERERFCTKHVIRKPVIPGGPETVVWLYGTHRTQGNRCDGPVHRRVPGWS